MSEASPRTLPDAGEGEPRVPGLNPRLRYAPRFYQAPTTGTVEDRLASISDELNRKANRAGIPNFAAIQLLGEDGRNHLVYVDSQGHLQCVPVTE